jgi:hypothetical protein
VLLDSIMRLRERMSRLLRPGMRDQRTSHQHHVLSDEGHEEPVLVTSNAYTSFLKEGSIHHYSQRLRELSNTNQDQSTSLANTSFLKALETCKLFRELRMIGQKRIFGDDIACYMVSIYLSLSPQNKFTAS